MNDDCLKLTTYFGERDRANGGFLADALTDIFAEHEVQTSLVLRGIEGFGVKHLLRTDRLLTLSEDLPIVSVAVDTRERVETILPHVDQLRFDGLITLERARMLTGSFGTNALASDLDEDTKLTVYVGRQERTRGRPTYEAVVQLLHDRGVAGATVLLGVDGTAHGARQRARFFGRNAAVPLMIIAVGSGRQLAAALPELGSMLARPLVTLERAQVCKRDGEKLAEPRHLPDADADGRQVWQKLMVYVSARAERDGHPLHHQLIRRLRHAGAAGATSLRGFWGYHGNHQPHGDAFLQLRRHVPVLTIVVDTPERIRTLFAIVDELTTDTGLVTSEMVPAFRSTGPSIAHGALTLARLRRH